MSELTLNRPMIEIRWKKWPSAVVPIIILQPPASFGADGRFEESILLGRYLWFWPAARPNNRDDSELGNDLYSG